MAKLLDFLGFSAGQRIATEGPVEVKKSAVAGLAQHGPESTWFGLPSPRWTSRNGRRLAEEGYRKNVIAHRCVRIIAEGAASVPWLLYRGDAKLRDHPLLDLLRRPNPGDSGTSLLEHFYAHLSISGNSYLEMVLTPEGVPGELYVLRPDHMSIIPGRHGWPAAYRYEAGGRAHDFVVDQVTGESLVLHMKTFNPLDDCHGLSPLEAAAFSIDIHNAASAWNKALFDNAARPSGALVYEPKEGGNLSDEQFARLKEELEHTYQGARNAGRPMLLEGGLRWQSMAFSPHDMEFVEGKHVAAREIAIAFGVPPLLLNIPGDNTYNNYQEANRALWRLTLLPLIEKTVSALNAWLVPRFSGDLRLDYDRDAITALQMERTAAWERLGHADFLTINEKRQAIGLDPVADGDRIGTAAS